MKQSFVYMLTNQKNGTLYIGITSDLTKRIYEHKIKAVKGFTQRYDLKILVYYEIFEDIKEAIRREKYLKGKKREFKIKLIESLNPQWRDLYEEIL